MQPAGNAIVETSTPAGNTTVQTSLQYKPQSIDPNNPTRLGNSATDGVSGGVGQQQCVVCKPGQYYTNVNSDQPDTVFQFTGIPGSEWKRISGPNATPAQVPNPAGGNPAQNNNLYVGSGGTKQWPGAVASPPPGGWPSGGTGSGTSPRPGAGSPPQNNDLYIGAGGTSPPQNPNGAQGNQGGGWAEKNHPGPLGRSQGNQGLGNQGQGNQGQGNQGQGNQGLGNQGLGNQGLGNQGLGYQGLGNQGLGNQGQISQDSTRIGTTRDPSSTVPSQCVGCIPAQLAKDAGISRQNSNLTNNSGISDEPTNPTSAPVQKTLDELWRENDQNRMREGKKAVEQGSVTERENLINLNRGTMNRVSNNDILPDDKNNRPSDIGDRGNLPSDISGDRYKSLFKIISETIKNRENRGGFNSPPR
jgi:hypothetical protein